MVAAIADCKAFRNGRQFAAWLGLVRRQHSSGDKQDCLESPSGVILISECYWYMEHALSSTAALERLIAVTYDRRQAAKDRHHESVCRRGEQERADHLGVAGQR